MVTKCVIKPVQFQELYRWQQVTATQDGLVSSFRAKPINMFGFVMCLLCVLGHAQTVQHAMLFLGDLSPGIDTALRIQFQTVRNLYTNDIVTMTLPRFYQQNYSPQNRQSGLMVTPSTRYSAAWV